MSNEEQQLSRPEALAERLSRGESKLVPIEQLKPNFWNPNQLGERQSEALGEAIDEHGFLDELLVRPHPAREGEYEVSLSSPSGRCIMVKEWMLETEDPDSTDLRPSESSLIQLALSTGRVASSLREIASESQLHSRPKTTENTSADGSPSNGELGKYEASERPPTSSMKCRSGTLTVEPTPDTCSELASLSLSSSEIEPRKLWLTWKLPQDVGRGLLVKTQLSVITGEPSKTKNSHSAFLEELRTLSCSDDVPSVSISVEPAETFEIIDGEHRYWKLLDYADQLNDPTLAIPVRVIEADDPEAKKLTIIMNETRGRADRVDLARLIADLKEDFGEELGRGLAFEQSELDELVALAAHSWEGYEDGSFADDGWRRFVAAMTAEDYEAYQEARNLVAREAELAGDEPVKNGQVVAALAAEYLAEYGGVEDE